MANKKQKSFNAELDDLIAGLELPSEADLKNETRSKKIGDKNRGRKLPPTSDSHREKKKTVMLELYRNGFNPTLGKKFSEESKAKLSNSLTGKQKSKSHSANISAARKGVYQGGNFKPILTPYGVFMSIKEAGIYEESITGKKFNPNRFTDLLKEPTSGYKRIYVEEYEKKVK